MVVQLRMLAWRYPDQLATNRPTELIDPPRWRLTPPAFDAAVACFAALLPTSGCASLLHACCRSRCCCLVAIAGLGSCRGMRRKPPRTIEDDLREWTPVTKLGRLVKLGKITKLEEIYVHSLPIREHQIIDQIFYNMGGVGPAGGGDDAFGRGGKVEAIKDEVMKVLTVQKQTKAGQRTRHKAFVTVGDYNGHVGLGVKCAKEVATAIRGAIAAAKLSIIPVRRGYWGNKIGLPHTVPMKVSGKCGSVRVRLIPAPRGTLVVGAPTTKKILGFAGVNDCFTSSSGSTKTRGNFMKVYIYAELAKFVHIRTHSSLT
eukprot:GHVU01064495.1.p1 GENE.GHVU01064495.1~~GHVU01064495.1.p1  ORF type:complete len:315 (+),score=50.45 GHVU01064495.1:464-1408(+)